MSSFLSAPEIVDAVKESKIRISYYAVRDSENRVHGFKTSHFVSLEPGGDQTENNRLSSAFFMESLEPDSLAFHVGPYALIEFPRTGEDRQYVQHRRSEMIFNIHEAGRLQILPGEFVLIGTNEYVEVGKSIGGSLYSNVRNTDVGLTHISTLIDPSWRGKLQIGVSNPTKFSVTLDYLDVLCIVRFHELRFAPEDSTLKRFEGRRPHFESDWWKIEAEKGRSFFPMRKEYSKGGEYEKAIAAANRRANIAKVTRRFVQSVGLLAAATAIFWVADLYGRLKDAAQNSDRISQLEDQQDVLHEMARTFHVLLSGSRIAKVGPDGAAEVYVPFGGAYPGPPAFLVSAIGLDSSAYTTEIDYVAERPNSNTYDGAKVTLHIRPAQPKSGEVQIVWLLARPRGD